jgi:hypothetical protein
VPSTFQALWVTVIGLLPGALYIWGFEREAGRWGASASDRVLRFVGASAIIHAAAFPVTWAVWRTQIRSGDLSTGRSNAGVLWLALLGFALAPTVLGTVVGAAVRRGRQWPRHLVGRNPAPRGWDHLFAREPRGWVRLRLKSGIWVGGLYASVGDHRSYAAGYPESQDIFLAQVADVDATTGEFLRENDAVRMRGTSLLVRWDEVEYLEFIEG